MTNNELKLISLIEESENPAEALQIAIETITEFIKANNL